MLSASCCAHGNLRLQAIPPDAHARRPWPVVVGFGLPPDRPAARSRARGAAAFSVQLHQSDSHPHTDHHADLDALVYTRPSHHHARSHHPVAFTNNASGTAHNTGAAAADRHAHAARSHKLRDPHPARADGHANRHCASAAPNQRRVTYRDIAIGDKRDSAAAAAPAAALDGQPLDAGSRSHTHAHGRGRGAFCANVHSGAQLCLAWLWHPCDFGPRRGHVFIAAAPTG